MQKYANSILVTGGAGFVGQAVVTELLDQTSDSQIAVLDNLFNGRRSHVPDSPRVTLYETDLTDEEAVLGIMRDLRPVTVVHLAALHFIPYCNAHPTETLDVNVVGTQNLLEACGRHAPERLVIASSAAVYPIRDGANFEDEAVGPTDIYGLSKWINEKQLELFSQQADTRCAAARLFNVFGPGETNPHVIPEIVNQIVHGAEEIAIGNVKPKRDYIYVTDVARALLTIAEKSEHSYRVYNVGTGAEYSVEEILEQLATISGRRLKLNVAANRVRASDRMHLLCDMKRIGNELGWRPEYTLESGLSALWQSVAEEDSRVELQAACAKG
ncbi:MAG: NAD(P)-dependent oxidoreductase [Planctomycetes bacterium]|nr:NAD(P)-dependent oxidoreductase [Planctomycetota bacterium]